LERKVTHPKGARISPDSRPIAYGAAGLASAIYLGAFATSFFGQASLAQHMLIPAQLQYVAPAVVDLALILFTMTTLVRRSRGESTLITNLATAFWTLVSIAANIFHVLIPAGPQASWSAGTYAGAALSALMPLAALGASLVIENVLIARPAPEPAVIRESVEVTQPADAPKPSAPVLVQPGLKAATPVVMPSSVPVKDQLRVAEPVAVATEPRPTPAPVHASRPVVAVASQPASHKPQAHESVFAPEVDWEALSKSERWELIQSMKAQKLSIPVIARQLGVSPSTVKRANAEKEAALHLQPA
jgi:hypothetical protein